MIWVFESQQKWVANMWNHSKIILKHFVIKAQLNIWEEGFSGLYIRAFGFLLLRSPHNHQSYLSYHIPEFLKTFQFPIKLRTKRKFSSTYYRVLGHLAPTYFFRLNLCHNSSLIPFSWDPKLHTDWLLLASGILYVFSNQDGWKN